MANEYSLLPVLSSFTATSTYTAGDTNTAVTIAGNLNLSAAQTYTTGVSTVGNFAQLNLVYTLGGTSLSALSASNTGVKLTVYNNTGNSVVYGYVASSTLVPSTSTATYSFKFYDPNYLATVFYLSSFKTTTAFLTSGATKSSIDNPFVGLTTGNVAGLPRYTTYGGLTSIGTSNYRSVAKQARLVQYEA